MRLNIGVIGVGGKGAHSLAAVTSENIVALCDIDEHRLTKASALFRNAFVCTDFRRLLDRKEIDAVLITTPDHTHAMATIQAMEMGKHVYCDKPLTHSIYEARKVAEVARRKKVATQMGNQTHSSSNYRQSVELIISGAIGTVQEVHAWTSLCWSGGDRLEDVSPIPAHINWDLWLGPAAERPYNPAYHPFYWRGWWDFGTGSLGDLGCHLMDPAFWALNLDSPRTIEAEGPAVHPESTPPWMIVRYEFGKRGEQPPVRLIFYHGEKRPPLDLFEGEMPPEHACLFLGDKGKLLVDFEGTHKLLPESDYDDFKAPEPFLSQSPGHYIEWINACKTGSPTGSNFSYAGRLTEAVLLGNVAYRIGKKLEWDSTNLKATNCPDAEQFIHREYRKGWSL